MNEYIDQRNGKNGDREQFQRMMDPTATKANSTWFCSGRWIASAVRGCWALQHLKRLTSHNVAFKSFTEQYLDGTGCFRERDHQHLGRSGSSGARETLSSAS